MDQFGCTATPPVLRCCEGRIYLLKEPVYSWRDGRCRIFHYGLYCTTKVRSILQPTPNSSGCDQGKYDRRRREKFGSDPRGKCGSGVEERGDSDQPNPVDQKRHHNSDAKSGDRGGGRPRPILLRSGRSIRSRSRRMPTHLRWRRIGGGHVDSVFLVHSLGRREPPTSLGIFSFVIPRGAFRISAPRCSVFFVRQYRICVSSPSIGAPSEPPTGRPWRPLPAAGATLGRGGDKFRRISSKQRARNRNTAATPGHSSAKSGLSRPESGAPPGAVGEGDRRRVPSVAGRHPRVQPERGERQRTVGRTRVPVNGDYREVGTPAQCGFAGCAFLAYPRRDGITGSRNRGEVNGGPKPSRRSSFP